MGKGGHRILATLFIGVVFFLLLPLVWVVARGLSLENFTKLFEREEIRIAAMGSLGLALASAILATTFGTLIAFALPDMPRLAKKLVSGGLVFPMVLPEIALGLSFMVWFIKLGMPLGWTTLVASHVAFSLSYSVFVMKSRVETLDHTLMDAARDLGADSWSVFRHALWPQLFPGIMASLITCFSLSLDDFLISFFVKGIDQKTLPIQIYSMMRIGVGGEIYSLSVILFCISLFVVLLSQLWLSAKSSKQTVLPS